MRLPALKRNLNLISKNQFLDVVFYFLSKHQCFFESICQFSSSNHPYLNTLSNATSNFPFTAIVDGFKSLLKNELLSNAIISHFPLNEFVCHGLFHRRRSTKCTLRKLQGHGQCCSGPDLWILSLYICSLPKNHKIIQAVFLFLPSNFLLQRSVL